MKNSILLVTIDCLRTDHVGCYGYERATTPTIDRLASEGVRYRRAYSNGCGTRFAFPSILGGVHTLDISGAGLPPAAGTTLAESLREAGYQTLGVANNGFLTRYFHYDRGFDKFIDVSDFNSETDTNVLAGVHEIAQTIGSTLEEAPGIEIARRIYNWVRSQVEAQGKTIEATDEATVDRAIKLLSTADNNEPIFLWVHLMDAHQPYAYQPLYYDALGLDIDASSHVRYPEEKVERGTEPPQAVIDGYDAAIRSADAQLGRLIDSVDDNWTVVVTADHGEEMGSHNEFHKFSPYETMARVPLVIRSANIQPGEVDRLVSHLDLPPTLANIGKSPVDEKWRGKSVTIVDEKSATDRQILLGHETPEYVGGGLVRYPWKYVFRQKGFNGQMLTESLHHLERDPKEQTDYKSQEQGRFDTLQTQCEELLASIQKNRLCSDRAIWDDSRSSKEAEKGEERSDEELSKDIEEQLKKLGYK